MSVLSTVFPEVFGSTRQRMLPTILEQQRRALCEHLYKRGIRSASVLSAIARVPREEFVHAGFRHRAYEDSALPISAQQTISQPFTVAYMTECLHVRAGAKILEIGTGSGYQAAILHALGAQVFTVERHEELYHSAKEIFTRLGLHGITMHLGDGTLGWREHAPYDGIIVTAAAPDVPSTLTDQLAEGGRLVIPVGNRERQTLYVITRASKASPTGFVVEEHPEFRFVPLIGEKGWNTP